MTIPVEIRFDIVFGFFVFLTGLAFLYTEWEEKQEDKWKGLYRKKDGMSGVVWYRGYLLTPRWRSIRRKVLERDNYRCTSCNRMSSPDNWLEVHHSTYTIIGKEEHHMHLLRTLCRECHYRLHHPTTLDKIKRFLSGS